MKFEADKGLILEELPMMVQNSIMEESMLSGHSNRDNVPMNESIPKQHRGKNSMLETSDVRKVK